MKAATAPALLSDDQRLAWLRLIRSDNIGPVTFRELINHFGSASAAIDAVPELARKGGRQIRLRSVADAERELAAATAAGARFVAMGEAEYPAWLRAIDGAPPLIAVKGNGGCLARPTIAVVGSRNASVAGRKFAMQISAGLGEAGFAIASGLARGIDAAAHTPARSRPAPSLSSPVDSIVPTRPKTSASPTPSSNGAATLSAKCRWGGNRAPAIFPAAIA